MAGLRESYSGCGYPSPRASPLAEEESRMEERTMGREEEPEESHDSLTQVPSVPSASSEEKLIDWFQEEYEKFLSGSAEEINVSECK